MTRLLSPLFLVILVLLIAGCAGSGVQPVSSPSLDEVTNVATVPDLSRAVETSPNERHLWGYWQCELDRDTMELHAIPARSALLHVNATGPLNKALAMTVSIQPESQPAQGLFVVKVGLTHPFTGNDKLTGFDVRGILITTAGSMMDNLPLPIESDPEMLNPDGYTRWWNPTEFTTPGLLGYTPGIYGKDPPPGTPLISGINPYKQFADGLYIDHPVSFLTLILPTSANGRGVFRSGVTNERLFRIQFPVVGGPKVFFNYAVDASWAPSNDDPPLIPNSFPLEANGPECFIVDAEVDSSTLWATGGPEAGGEIDITIECWDWQGWVGEYDGEIGALTLASPYCDFDEGIVPEVEESPQGYATLTATVPGLAAQWGDIPVWIGITAPGSNYKQAFQTAPNALVAAYDFVTVHVDQAECEANDNMDCNTAYDIGYEDEQTGMLCPDVDETDWYAFTVLPGGNAVGTITLTSYDTGDLTLILYRGCPPSLISYSSIPASGDEEIILDGLTADDYYIEVAYEPDSSTGPRPYGLTTAITGVGENCTTDENNLPEQAEAIELDGDDSDTICLVGDASDWYTFSIAGGVTGYGTIDLDNDDYANNDLAVYDENLTTPLYIGNNAGTLDEHLEVTLPSGTFYIEVSAEDTEPMGDRNFTLELDLMEFAGDCDNDDDNNTPDEAVQLSTFQMETGTVCFPSDPDWYTIDVQPPGVDGTITLSSGNVYDNDLALYEDPYAPPIEESAHAGAGDETITVDGLSSGIYYIEATASGVVPGTNQDYQLSTALTETIEVPTDFYLRVHIVRTTQGDNPAANETTVESHADWADEFYQTWIGGSVTIDEISYIDNTGWLSLTTDEAETMFAQNWDDSGALHVFYVNDFPDMPGAAAYAYMDCQFILQDHSTGFVCMSDYTDDATLAHEMGHAIGLLGDMYLLDFYTCEEITWCPSGPSDIFCLESDADLGNIMYWPIGSNIDDYWISITDLEMLTPEIDSQGENIVFFHDYYPDAFYQP